MRSRTVRLRLFHARALGAALVLALVPLAATPLRAQPLGSEMLLASDTSRALLAQARVSTLALRFDDAEASLRRLQRRPDGAPAALHHRATIALLRGFLTDDDLHFTRFAQRADSLERTLGRMPETRWRLYFEAETDLQRAIVHARRENLTRAALAARSAHNAYEKALRGDVGATFEEPQKGFGLIQLLIGSAPGAYRWMLRLMGYSGTIEGGRGRLVRAAERSRYNREESLLLLGLVDVVVRGDHAGGLATVERLYREQPGSPLAGHVYGFTLLSDRRAEAAEAVLAGVVEAQRGPGVQPIRFSEYFLGDARFKLGKYDAAAGHLRRYLDSHRGASLRSRALLTLGLCLELQGRRAEALGPYRQVKHTRISEVEEAAVRLARRRLAAPITPAERTLLEATNLYENRAHEAAEAKLRAFLATNPPAGEAAEANVRLGRVLVATARAAEARTHFEQAYEQPGPDALAGWAPWAHFHAGETLAAEGQKAEARRHFERTIRYEGNYDLYLTLEQNTKTALEKVR